MSLSIKKYCRLLTLPLTMLFFQSIALAQPVMIPGFMGIESSYIDAPEGDTRNAYFTISNLHYEPIVLLSATGDAFGNASFTGANNEELENVIIQPGERLVMGPDNIHLQLSELDAEISVGEKYPITLLVRRGLEPEEEVLESDENFGAMSGMRVREAGIPNEQDYVVNVPVRN